MIRYVEEGRLTFPVAFRYSRMSHAAMKHPTAHEAHDLDDLLTAFLLSERLASGDADGDEDNDKTRSQKPPFTHAIHHEHFWKHWMLVCQKYCG